MTVDYAREKAMRQMASSTATGRRFVVTNKAALSGEEVVVQENVLRTHTAEPIKDPAKIEEVSNYLISMGKYRDNLIFIAGINFGYRISDLLSLKVGDILDANGYPKEKIVKEEKKTKKRRVVYLNEAVMEAFSLYYEDRMKKRGSIDISEPLFVGDGGRSAKSLKPICRQTVDRMLKETVAACHIQMDNGQGTHLLRKTFAYHVIIGAKDRPRAIELLQKMLNHSSAAITLRYAGITDEEIMGVYKNLNLGYKGFSANISKSAGCA